MMNNLTKKFIKLIILDLRNRGILNDVLQSSGIHPIEYMQIKEHYKPFEDDSRGAENEKV